MTKHKKKILAGVVSLLMLIALLGNVQPTSVRAASSSELKQQLDELESENAELEAELEALRNQYSGNLDELTQMVARKDTVDQEIRVLNEQLGNLNTQISAYALLIADKQEELDKAQDNLTQLQIKNKQRIRAMEENGPLSYWSVLFEASSFTEMLDRLEMIQEIAKADIRCLEEMDAAAKEVAKAKELLVAEQTALQEKREAMAAIQVELEKKRAETDQLLIELKAKGDEFELLILDSEKLQEELMAEIAAKTDEYEDAKYLEWLATSRPSAGIGSGTVVDGITWLMPCSHSGITSPFGYRWHPVDGDWRMHNGVDLAAPSGTPIYATRSGYVTVSAYQAGGAGNYIALSHGDGFGSIYMHMTHYVVYAGEYVSAGQVIGYVGSTGGSTGPHLHFGISYNGVYVNPVDYINF